MLILVMGVTGSGKTTIGLRLAARLKLPFHDADEYHPLENLRKMARNEPLDDADRWPWLERLARESRAWQAHGGAVLACSALKQAYRRVLLGEVDRARIVYLKIELSSVVERLEGRRGLHEIVSDFDRILAGQFRDLEEPEGAIAIPARLTPPEIVERAARRLAREGLTGGRVRIAEGGPDTHIDEQQARSLIDGLVSELPPARRVLLIPPDYTRAHSGAGELTQLLYERLGGAEVDVLPAVGTHRAMTVTERESLFPRIPAQRFLEHDFRQNLLSLGEVPASFVSEVSGGLWAAPIPCEVNAKLVQGGYDRIFSIGQLVPHEVAGIAGHSKNVFVGVGGKSAIDRTHFLGALCGIESILGEACNPVRDVLSYMGNQLGSALPLTHVLTVRARDASGALRTRGLFAGDDDACYFAGAPLARASNTRFLSEPEAKVVVYLHPAEYKSTWLGNKAIYRARLALRKGGELVVIAPGVDRFGEDPDIDRLVRRHGYYGRERTLAAVASDPELAGTLAAAAHLIHGSGEGRFRVVYAAGGLSPSELAAVGYESMSVDDALQRYEPTRMSEGVNVLPDGERIFFVSNPALGLWDARTRH
ncbi:MAG TPA: gluconokinase, GntK/IdnK-type [Polyangiaceae bacterium]|nr:gluconokinase, GntK/IdnK-type [Polyangiaceae bacterium]